MKYNNAHMLFSIALVIISCKNMKNENKSETQTKSITSIMYLPEVGDSVLANCIIQDADKFPLDFVLYKGKITKKTYIIDSKIDAKVEKINVTLDENDTIKCFDESLTLSSKEIRKYIKVDKYENTLGKLSKYLKRNFKIGDCVSASFSQNYTDPKSKILREANKEYYYIIGDISSYGLDQWINFKNEVSYFDRAIISAVVDSSKCTLKTEEPL